MSQPRRSRRTEAERVDQARAAWLAVIDQLTEGHPDVRRTWSGDDAVAALEAVGGPGQSVVALSGRLLGDVAAPTRLQDVERFGEINFTVETTPTGETVLAMPSTTGRIWLAPAALTYLPCPASPVDGVFVLTVADAVAAPPGQKLPFGAYLERPSGAGLHPRWVAGGLVLAHTGSRVETSALEVPGEAWFDFPALVRWAGRLLDTPPPRTTAEGLDDPAVLDTLTEALTRYRAATGAVRHGAKATQGDVNAIARAAIASGLQPTVAMLTRVLGRGSASTLHPLLKGYFRRAVPDGLLPGAEVPAPSDVPPAFFALLDQLRAAAKADVDQALAPQRAALAEREAAAAAREAELTAAQADLEQTRAHQASAEQERARYVAHLETQLAEVTLAREQAQNVATGHEALIHRLEADATTARERYAELQQRMDSELNRAREEIRTLTAADRSHLQAIARLETERDAVTTARDQLVSALDQHQREAATAREDAVRHLADAQAVGEAHRQAREAAERSAARWQEEHEQVRTALTAQQHGADALRTRLEDITAELAEQRQAQAAVRAEIAALRQERDRLDSLLRLGASPAIDQPS